MQEVNAGPQPYRVCNSHKSAALLLSGQLDIGRPFTNVLIMASTMSTNSISTIAVTASAGIVCAEICRAFLDTEITLTSIMSPLICWIFNLTLNPSKGFSASIRISIVLPAALTTQKASRSLPMHMISEWIRVVVACRISLRPSQTLANWCYFDHSNPRASNCARGYELL